MDRRQFLRESAAAAVGAGLSTLTEAGQLPRENEPVETCLDYIRRINDTETLQREIVLGLNSADKDFREEEMRRITGDHESLVRGSQTVSALLGVAMATVTGAGTAFAVSQHESDMVKTLAPLSVGVPAGGATYLVTATVTRSGINNKFNDKVSDLNTAISDARLTTYQFMSLKVYETLNGVRGKSLNELAEEGDSQSTPNPLQRATRVYFLKKARELLEKKN